MFGFCVSVYEQRPPYFQYRVSPLTATSEEMFWRNVAHHSNARIQIEKVSQHERSARIGTGELLTRVTSSHSKQKASNVTPIVRYTCSQQDGPEPTIGKCAWASFSFDSSSRGKIEKNPHVSGPVRCHSVVAATQNAVYTRWLVACGTIQPSHGR